MAVWQPIGHHASERFQVKSYVSCVRHHQIVKFVQFFILEILLKISSVGLKKKESVSCHATRVILKVF